MHAKTKLLKAELKLLRPVLTRQNNLQIARAAQDEAGKLMASRKVAFEDIPMAGFEACYATPQETMGEGVILYLHGGGYTAGSLQYAKGFGSALAGQAGLRALCVAYRLAPEHPYPAALEDALQAYRYLLAQGNAPGGILLCGESAGGGLCFALCLKLRDLGLPLPGGVAAISPWVDLTLSGPSYTENAGKDPLLCREMLAYYVQCYAPGQDPANPYISPLFGDLRGMPPSLLFAGGDELLLSEAQALHRALLEAGVNSRLHVSEEMWHAYLLYGTEEGKKDMQAIIQFIREMQACASRENG